MIRPLSAAVLATLILSACAPVKSFFERSFSPQAATQPAAQSAARPAAGPAEAPPLPRRKPGAISASTLAGADPQRLVGLDFDGTKALLGDPAARIDQAPAKVWAYAGGGCMFNVFFFPSIDDQVFRVLAIEVTGESPAPNAAGDEKTQTAAPKIMSRDDPAVRQCFADLLQNQQDRNAG